MLTASLGERLVAGKCISPVLRDVLFRIRYRFKKNPRQYPVHTSLLTYCVLDLIVNGSNMDLRVSGDFFRMNLTIIVNQTLSYYLLNYEPSVK